MILTKPSIDPVIFSLGFVDIRWYSLAYVAAFILGVYLIKKLNHNIENNIDNKIIDNFFVWSIIGVILGGRIGYVLFYQFEIFLSNPLYIFFIWRGGMSFHGGLLGMVVSLYFFSNKNNIKFYALADLICLAAPIGLFFGRIANFINTELIGRPTDFFISVIYPSIDNLSRHPSQLYEAFLEGILLFIILMIFIYNKKIKNGFCSSLFLILYGTFRIFCEQFREPDEQIGYLFNLFSLGTVLSFIMIVAGIIVLTKIKSNE